VTKVRRCVGKRRASTSSGEAVRSRKWRPYPGVQDGEVSLVANSDGSRCTGASAIACRSPVWRTARSGRGRSRRSGAQTKMKTCQRGARDWE
jgi:hypothetical protein